MLKVGLIGNPNVGKTMLFNKFTACHSCVGNWAGVTTTCKQSKGCNHMDDIDIIDFPGCYHLSEEGPQADKSTKDRVGSQPQAQQVDVWVNVIDASALRRQLYLTLQILELNQPVIVVLNRMDLLKQEGLEIDMSRMSGILGCPVLGVSAKIGWGLKQLEKVIQQYKSSQDYRCGAAVCRYPEPLEVLVAELEKKHAYTRHQAVAHCLQQSRADNLPAFMLTAGFTQMLRGYGAGLMQLVAQTRHDKIETIMHACVRKPSATAKVYSQQLDGLLLHRWLGLPCFALMMFITFWLSMGLGQCLQSILEPIWISLFVHLPGWLNAQLGGPLWLGVLLTKGVGLGVVTAFSFLPILWGVFFALVMLEESGYMSRAAVVIDRIMRILGLPGESLVALILGFGCNVPGILATTHVPKRGDRIITTMMLPFMSCSARLAIFATFSNAFFATQAAKVLCLLYATGLVVAGITGWLVKQYVGEEAEEATYCLELPAYQWPGVKATLATAAKRSWRFVYKALPVIAGVCMVLALLGQCLWDGRIVEYQATDSVLAWMAKKAAYCFYPLGLTTQQWPLVIALITGLLAKEVVISSLALFYAGVNIGNSYAWYKQAQGLLLLQNLGEELQQALIQQWHSLINYGAIAPEAMPWINYEQMGFSSEHHVIAYMIFILLYFPCISTLYAIARQLSWSWAWLSLAWSIIIAYMFAAGYLALAQSPSLQVAFIISIGLAIMLSIYLEHARQLARVDQPSSKNAVVWGL